MNNADIQNRPKIQINKKVFSGLQQLKHPGSQFPKIYFQMLADKTYIDHNVVICEPDMAALKPSRKKNRSMETKQRG